VVDSCWYGTYIVWCLVSGVWSGQAQLWEGRNGTWGRNRVIRSLSGDWLLPLYNESQKKLGHQYEVRGVS
jgi:hypothetical protein